MAKPYVLQKLEQLISEVVSARGGKSSLSARLSSIENKFNNNSVTSVNGRTGDVQINVPVTSVNGKTGAVNIPSGVRSVNGKDNVVTLTKEDVGLGNVPNYIMATTSELSNNFTDRFVNPYFLQQYTNANCFPKNRVSYTKSNSNTVAILESDLSIRYRNTNTLSVNYANSAKTCETANTANTANSANTANTAKTATKANTATNATNATTAQNAVKFNGYTFAQIKAMIDEAKSNGGDFVNKNLTIQTVYEVDSSDGVLTYNYPKGGIVVLDFDKTTKVNLYSDGTALATDVYTKECMLTSALGENNKSHYQITIPFTSSFGFKINTSVATTVVMHIYTNK